MIPISLYPEHSSVEREQFYVINTRAFFILNSEGPNAFRLRPGTRRVCCHYFYSILYWTFQLGQFGKKERREKEKKRRKKKTQGSQTGKELLNSLYLQRI